MFLSSLCILLLCLQYCVSVDEKVFPERKYLVPNIVHQVYDYVEPTFITYLSLLCVQRFIKPDKHILWVNKEDNNQVNWDNWQKNATKGSWQHDLLALIQSNKIHVELTPFPIHPPGNRETFVVRKDHRSDMVRMKVLKQMGGIYLDTDAFVVNSIDSLRIHNFTISFDNVVNSNTSAPKRFNNGVLFAAPFSHFLHLWMEKYSTFSTKRKQHLYHSSTIPYELSTQYPDLVHIEENRISPISYGYQTALAAYAITCGILVPPTATSAGAIWYPQWESRERKTQTFNNTVPDAYMYEELSKKLVFHMTMSKSPENCQIQNLLHGPDTLKLMPSLLGKVFRIALYGHDSFDYTSLIKSSDEVKLAAWNACKLQFDMRHGGDVDDGRQQYTETDLLHRIKVNREKEEAESP